MRVVIQTCDRYLWALKGFAHQFAKYWPGQMVLVAGNNPPPFTLPESFTFISIGDYPKQRWGEAMIRILTQCVREDHFIFMHEDYWLSRCVDRMAVYRLGVYAEDHPDVLRIDLTTDRLYAAGVVDIGSLDHLDLIESDPNSAYNFSHQCAIFNKEHYLRIIEPAWTPQDCEFLGTEKLRTLVPRARVLGTRQAPVRYAIALRGGDPGTLHWTGQYPAGRVISLEDEEELRQAGCEGQGQ